MDSRLIYKVINSLTFNITWQLQGESEWIYTGIGKELKKDFVFHKLAEMFKNETIYIELGRTDSKEISNENFDTEIFERIGKLDFKVCDKNFKNFIEFNKIGVMRIGKK